ncbi:two-component system, sensor histidine kinase PdtaS [Methylomarinovum caldicuralii]|uniref:histidine kinase n=1 Tax=Methylomarinovum caldicuralii TaxID=438856 RepID=A0AAU9BSD7_9GAMM|nr:PAS domain-containing protein [Methylomarinovum caldicuralii]BCX81783.1 two-component system, sensor histidine kinase PdtaS [Methylomarinovum caldicuralii]
MSKAISDAKHAFTTCGCYDADLIGVLHLNDAGVIEAANTYVRKLLGIAGEQLCGRRWQDLCRAEEYHAVCDWWRQLLQEGKATALEVCLQRAGGPPCPVLVSGRRNGPGRVMLLVLDISRQRAREAEVLERERRQRNLLIREVHHRIKNNLQGIVGLLQNQLLEHPELAPFLEIPIRQINSITLTYGLRSCQDDDKIYLCDLVRVAARASDRTHPIPLTLDVPRYCNIVVNDNDAVAIALVLNELLFNAAKHGHTSAPRISLHLRRSSEEAVVTVRNRYQGPRLKADLNRPETLSTGLQLVQGLLPKDGSAQLRLFQQDDEVIAELRLRPPVVKLVTSARQPPPPAPAAG